MTRYRPGEKHLLSAIEGTRSFIERTKLDLFSDPDGEMANEYSARWEASLRDLDRLITQWERVYGASAPPGRRHA